MAQRGQFLQVPGQSNERRSSKKRVSKLVGELKHFEKVATAGESEDLDFQNKVKQGLGN